MHVIGPSILTAHICLVLIISNLLLILQYLYSVGVYVVTVIHCTMLLASHALELNGFFSSEYKKQTS